MKVAVERYLMQVEDGSQYKGYIKIGESKFVYELVFSVPIPKLDDIEPTDDAKEINRLFKLTLKKDETVVELTDAEYVFFCQMLVPLAVNFYHDSETRRSNDNLLSAVGRLIDGKHPLSAYGASASIGVTTEGFCDFPSKIREMLSEPKFGCALAA